MNPPFSVKSWSNGLENEYGRFEFGRPPEKNGDYAFLLHVIKSLKSTGKAAIIMPHGVLFRGHAEAAIRRELLKRGYIKGIIGLPPNLFYGTGIPACIVVLDKENAAGAHGVFMIDASKGFMKDGPKNRLRSQDIHKIVDVFNKQTEIERYSRMVPLDEIAEPKQRLQPQHPALHRLLRARGHPGPPCSPARRHPRPRHRRARRLLGRLPAAARAAVQAATGPATATSPSTSSSVSRPSSTRPSSRSSRTKSDGMVDEWFAAHRSTLARHRPRTPSPTS